jgi:hypothetical protein
MYLAYLTAEEAQIAMLGRTPSGSKSGSGEVVKVGSDIAVLFHVVSRNKTPSDERFCIPKVGSSILSTGTSKLTRGFTLILFATCGGVFVRA